MVIVVGTLLLAAAMGAADASLASSSLVELGSIGVAGLAADRSRVAVFLTL